MINRDDIIAFQQENAQVLAAAEEFRRRSKKRKGKVGPEPDRWASTSGLRDVAEGIGAMLKIMNAQSTMIVELARALREDERRSIDSMGLHTQDSKYSEAGH